MTSRINHQVQQLRQAMPASPDPQPANAEEPAIGPLRLHLERRELIGLHGQVRLEPALFRMMELLIRQPGAPVSVAAIGKALRADPECKADQRPTAEYAKALRGAIAVLTRDHIRLLYQPTVGYTLKDRRPGRA